MTFESDNSIMAAHSCYNATNPKQNHTHTHRCSVIENNAFCSDVGSVLSANYVIKKLFGKY